MATEHKHKFAAIVLAAGEGKRMRSQRPKVMHALAGKPMIAHVLSALTSLAPQKTVVITSPRAEEVKAYCAAEYPGCLLATQDKPQGTGHAAMQAETKLSGYKSTILVVCGDTPLITANTLRRALEASVSAEIVVVGMRLADPTGYGRLIVDAQGQLEEIIEERDATTEQKRITLCNSGVMAVSGKYFFQLLKKLTVNNAAGEYYLTDIVSQADLHNLHCRVVEADATELLGINTRPQLAAADAALQQRLRHAAMEQGATLMLPESIYLSADTVLGKDAVVYPHVVFGPGVVVKDNAEIRSFSHLEGATVEKGAVIGPFARLRPGTVIGENARVGNFVEVKKSALKKGAKANHLSYIGDATVGEGANIGAGTITCNYDGKEKHKTVIGRHAFIGSNTALVAPVIVGEGAVVGAGSVITEDVPIEGLAIARATQINKSSRVKAKIKRRQKG